MEKLALLGGQPLYQPLEKQNRLDPAAAGKAMQQVLDQGQWGTLGDEALAFSCHFSQYSGCRFGISVNSGPMAVELILRSLGIGYGDEVIVSAYSPASLIMSITLCGAWPVLADIRPDTCHLDIQSVRAQIGPATRAVLASHIGGQIDDPEPLQTLCREHGLHLIEDAAHAAGATWQDQSAGTFGLAAGFSFSFGSALDCGEGGFIATNDENLFKICWHYHHSGRSYDDASEFAGTVWMGNNARLAEWQAAVLNLQLCDLDQIIGKKNQRAKWLEALDIPFLKPRPRFSPVTRDTCQSLLWHYDPDWLGVSKPVLVRALQAEGLPVSSGYTGVQAARLLDHELVRRATGRCFHAQEYNLPHTEQAWRQSMVWLSGTFLLQTEKQLQVFADALEKVSVQAEALRRMDQPNGI